MQVVDIDEPADRARPEEPPNEIAEIERFRRFIDNASPEDFGRP